MNPILALDFDGVLCDSARELALSAWRAGAAIWPDWQNQEPPDILLEQFKKARPVLETGHEAIPLLALLHQGLDTETLMLNAHEQIAAMRRQIGHDENALNDLLAGARRAWVEADLEGWLAAHGFYPGTVEGAKDALAEGVAVYIITTKQEAFTRRLLQAQGLILPDERIYSLEQIKELGGKSGVLAGLLQAHPETPIAFVEDRLETLEAVLARPDLGRVHTYLADWGFNTAATRERAGDLDGIEVISLADFPPRL
ncbi:MAG: HAD family hydrolase [Candidatus Latescibacteria bacterium]|nr:HAD family hydrolase [Candidatus Latescibacterota bacterium]